MGPRLSPAARIVPVLALLLAACSSTPEAPLQGQGHPAVSVATRLLGAPYRYGGAGPHGFDCSGLVYYSFRRAGIRVPRTTSAQLGHATRIPRNRLQPGDLLFFRIDHGAVSHVAIYTGQGRFIHAPSGGKRVRYGAMNSPYWQERLVAAGRYQ